MQRITLQSIDSTNTFVKEKLARGVEAPLLVTAVQQTGGRGQYNRRFSSPTGGAYFSLGISPILDKSDIPLITLATGVACAQYLQELSSLQVQLKWPNDLYVSERKIGGILCETFFKNDGEIYTIIGVGINVNTRLGDFAVELQPILTSIREQTKQEYSIETVISCCAKAIVAQVAILQQFKGKIIAQWQDHDYLQDRFVEYVAGEVKIKACGVGILPSGRYRIVDEIGEYHDVLGGQLRPIS